MSVRFAIEPLAKAHKRDDFICGNDRIDSYFRETVSQDVKRKYATCFVARRICADLAGFYSIRSTSNGRLTDGTRRGEAAAHLSGRPSYR